jgi:hypothetical protein
MKIKLFEEFTNSGNHNYDKIEKWLKETSGTFTFEELESALNKVIGSADVTLSVDKQDKAIVFDLNDGTSGHGTVEMTESGDIMLPVKSVYYEDAVEPVEESRTMNFDKFAMNETTKDNVENFLEDFVSNHIEGKFGFPAELVWNAGSGERLGTYSLDSEGNESSWAEVFIDCESYKKLNFNELEQIFKTATEGKHWETSVMSNDEDAGEEDGVCSVTFNVEFGNKRFRR